MASNLLQNSLIVVATALLSQAAHGEIPPPPELTSPDGQAYSAPDYADRLVLINFWAAWCAPCRAEMPDLDELQAHYDPEQFTVLGIAADEMDLVNRFLDTVPVSYPIYVGDPDAVFNWSAKLGNRILGLPFSVMVDRAGNVRWVKSGGRISIDDLAPVIDDLLAEESPQAGPPIGAPNFNDAPPPMPKDSANVKRAAAGDAAPDGLGITMGRSPTAGAYNEDTLTYVPWEDASEIDPLPQGAVLPAGSQARDRSGAVVDLNAAVRAQPTILIYFRGSWCPFCNAHLRELQGSVDELGAMGYQVLAVSTDTVDGINAHDESTNYSYELLSDGSLELAARLGLKFRVAQEYIDHVRALPPGVAFDLVERNGGYLAVPATYVFDTDGVARFVYTNTNYTVRIRQEALLQAARDALQH